MALYICAVTVTLIVDADWCVEATELAIDHARDELRNAPDCLVRKVTDPDDVPTAWLDSIPYGDEGGDLTVAQRMAEMFRGKAASGG
jgi:hypothetical protein